MMTLRYGIITGNKYSMQNRYLVLGIIGLAVIALLGGVLIFTKSQNSSQQGPELQIQISPSEEKNLAFPTPLETGITAQEIPLEILSPKDQTSLSSNQVKISGKTKARADVVVNDQELKADTNGNFSTQITLDEGENIIGIVAYDADGNYAEKELLVSYEPAE